MLCLLELLGWGVGVLVSGLCDFCEGLVCGQGHFQGLWCHKRGGGQSYAIGQSSLPRSRLGLVLAELKLNERRLFFLL